MIGNAVIPGLTSAPASVSPAAIDGLLRGQLGFRGLVLTDSLSAAAVKNSGFDVPHAAANAISAGADMVLFNEGTATADAVAQQLEAAVGAGTLTTDRLNDAVGHVLAAKKVDLCRAGA
jgi:beta-N-acetylhexosaminidase